MTKEEAVKELTELLPEEFLSEYTDAIKMAIEALSSSENPNKWIPCSERLPEEHKEVLTCSLGGFIEIQSYEDGCGGYWENQKGDWSDICEVVAWMPLPEPYKPEIPTVAEGSDE